jgi:thioredoxin 1
LKLVNALGNARCWHLRLINLVGVRLLVVLRFLYIYKYQSNMETFQDIISGDKLVLVDFFATWCGPCKTMSPVVELIGKELQGQARVLKIDVDKNRATAARYKVQAVPTFIIFKKGEVVWRNAGGVDKATLMQQIRKFV